MLEFTGVGEQANNGGRPGYGALLLHSDGNIYGTTQEGGSEGGGTVFRLRFGPTPITLAAEPIRAASADLRGTINPNGNATTVKFEIGTSPSLQGAATVNAATSNSDTEPYLYRIEATGLVPDTVYYYRIVGTNVANAVPQRGAILSFTTRAANAPVVTLLGDNPLTWEASNSYSDPGATAADAEEGTLAPMKTSDTVVPAVPGAYAVTWSATDGDGLTGTATRTINVVDTTKPLVVVPADIFVVTQEPAGKTVEYAAATATDFVGVTEVIYSHPSGSVFRLGITKVTVTARDAAGNQGVGTFNVRVTLQQAVHQVVALEGSAVPGAGVDPRVAAGAVWANFGSPAISASGKVAFTGRWTAASSESAGKGLFINGALAAAVGDSSPISGTTISQLSAPVYSQDSDAVLVAANVVGSGADAGETGALLSFAPTAGVLASVGQETGLGEGIEIGRFVGATLSSGSGLVLARLRGGQPAVDSTNNLALFATTSSGLVTLARTGQTILGKTVAGLGLLKPVPGSPAHGRGEASAVGVRFIARFSDQTQAIVESAEPGAFIARAQTGELTGESGTSPYWASFGPAVSSSADGSRFAFRAGTVPPLNEGTPPTDAIFTGSPTGSERVASIGSPAPDNAQGAFLSFGEPVLSTNGDLMAFVGRLGPRQFADTGIFAVRGDGPLATVATLKSEPPGAPAGTRWKTFVSLAAPGGGVGPVFLGRLELGGAITEANNDGLWAVDASGVLRSVVREGDELAGKQVKSIQALKAVNGIAGATRSFNSAQQLVWKAAFTDQTSAIVLTTLP
jgi:uncharacterized repeat protein (TIGR03803 family)